VHPLIRYALRAVRVCAEANFMRVLVLPRYGVQGASSRLRFYQFLPALKAAGLDSSVSPLIDDGLLLRKYRTHRYGAVPLLVSYAQRVRALLSGRRFDLLWIEKEALPWLPAWVEKALLGRTPYVLDFDDAIFHNYDRHHSAWVRSALGSRIDKLMAGAQVVIAGNGYLAKRAGEAGASRVQIMPTVVDLERYLLKPVTSSCGRVRIVWIGSPSTARYLSMIAEPLADLARTHEFTLRVIGDSRVHLSGVDVETVEWSADSEAAMIRECDIGVMPLANTEWELGKCAYKLIQYMACGLPTVASPVGSNTEVTVDGRTGYLAYDASDWTARLSALMTSETLRRRLGAEGRARVEQSYSLQRIAPLLTEALRHAGRSPRCAG
jgi:glycosyltransferase involved in cell wall biosynthesis